MNESNQLDIAINAMRNFWNKRVKESKNDNECVDSTRRAQRMRFESFLIYHDLSDKTLLDIGCGAGDLWEHLQRRFPDCDYTGIDISTEMITRSRERFPAAKFEVCNVLDWTPESDFDYIVAIAIHNIRTDGGSELLRRMMKWQFEHCRIAAHLSLLTNRYKDFADHIQPWPPEKILSMALEVSPYVVLRHDYLPNDFSITIYREPLIDTRSDLLLD